MNHEDLDDDISEITLVDNDLEPTYYLSFQNKPVEKIVLDIFSSDTKYMYYIFTKKNNKLCQIEGNVQKTDTDLEDTICRIFFESANHNIFNENEILCKKIFFILLQSQQTSYTYKKCVLKVSIKIDSYSLKNRTPHENIIVLKKYIQNT
jgi:hypothetical protein